MIARHFIGKYVIVRTTGAGIHAGVLSERASKNVVLTNSRRIWYWKGAFTLSAIAIKGLDGSRSRLGAALDEIFISDVWEIIPCSKQAQDSIENAPTSLEASQ